MSRTLALAAGVENARRVPLASTGAVEAVLSAAAVAPPRALSSASSGWNTPLPQSSAEDAVHLVGAEVMACAFLPVTACYRLLFFPSFFSLIMFFLHLLHYWKGVGEDLRIIQYLESLG